MPALEHAPRAGKGGRDSVADRDQVDVAGARESGQVLEVDEPHPPHAEDAEPETR
jgi:hypothetical protein